MDFLYSSSVGPTNSHSGPKWQSSILALEFVTKLNIKVVNQELQLSVELFVLHNWEFIITYKDESGKDTARRTLININ